MSDVAQRRRIGVFGGAFDPPHLAHQALLTSAMAELGLDELHVIPTGQAWHKARTLTAPEHRLAMAQLAFSKLPNVLVDAQEIERKGPSYTIDTLRGLAQTAPQAELFLIMGADQAAALTTWRAWQDIVQLAIICVADRADSTGASTLFDAEKLFPARFFHLKMPALSISATQIRATISARQPVDTLVQNSVARYIADHHLYQSI
jgi:nicotinate-nucleotide adenylyltransferase